MGKCTVCCKNKPDPKALDQQDDETFLNDTNIPTKLTKEERKRQQQEVNMIEEEVTPEGKKGAANAGHNQSGSQQETADTLKEKSSQKQNEAKKANTKQAKKEAAKAAKEASKEKAKEASKEKAKEASKEKAKEAVKADENQAVEADEDQQQLDEEFDAQLREEFGDEGEEPAPKQSKPKSVKQGKQSEEQDANSQSKMEAQSQSKKSQKSNEKEEFKRIKEAQKVEQMKAKEAKKEEERKAKEAKKEQAMATKEAKKNDPVRNLKEIEKAKNKQIENDKKIKMQSLKYHQHPVPGKFVMVPTKALQCQRDLALAHTPGVTEPCLQISKKPEAAYRYTAKGRTVACISNGTSVLGLGNIGALAAKPDIEGKSVLYKQFSGIDCVDLCLDTPTADGFINTVKYLGPSFGAICLESIKAPDCFEIEAALREELDIPVFHNDQHGSGVMVLAGLMNALEITNKKLSEVKIVINGAGAAGIGTFNLLVAAGANKDSCFICDTAGLIYSGRAEKMNEYKEAVATTMADNKMTLEQIGEGADVLIGFSDAEVFSQKLMQSLNTDPIVFALSNPYPEILPERAMKYRPDCIIATARPEHDNQINNMMAFPFVFRAVLDTQASGVNDEMLIAAAEAIAALAKEPVPESVRNAYEDREFEFGPNYIVPTPFDSRLLEYVSCAVAQMAQQTGVAKNEIMDFNQYQNYLVQISSGAEDAQFVTKQKQ